MCRSCKLFTAGTEWDRMLKGRRARRDEVIQSRFESSAVGSVTVMLMFRVPRAIVVASFSFANRACMMGTAKGTVVAFGAFSCMWLAFWMLGRQSKIPTWDALGCPLRSVISKIRKYRANF